MVRWAGLDRTDGREMLRAVKHRSFVTSEPWDLTLNHSETQHSPLKDARKESVAEGMSERRPLQANTSHSTGPQLSPV